MFLGAARHLEKRKLVQSDRWQVTRRAETKPIPFGHYKGEKELPGQALSLRMDLEFKTEYMTYVIMPYYLLCGHFQPQLGCVQA